MGEKVLIGQLLVLPNAEKNQINYSLKIIRVKNSKKLSIPKLNPRKAENEFTILNRVFSQAFTKLNIENKEALSTKNKDILEIDIYDEFRNFLTKDRKIKANIVFAKELRDMYFRSIRESDNNSFIVFIVDEEAVSASKDRPIGGFTPYITIDNRAPSYEKTRTTVLFNGRNNYTFAHEFLHCINIGHTHRDMGENGFLYKNQKYIFQYNSNITNIMSYSKIKKAILFQWQWKIINPRLIGIIDKKLNKQ